MTDVTAVVVTLRDSPRLRAAIASVHAAAVSRRVEVVCVVNEPGAVGTWTEEGVRFVGAGMNLGWAAGMHAGLIDADGTYVWAIQDDLVVAPGSLDILCDHLESDDGLAAVRPLNVDGDGLVPRAGLGGTIDDRTGLWSDPIPASPTPAERLADARTGSFLPSSGQLVRRDVWDAVGGFDPWFYPWGFIDIDFARTLRASGWRFAHVPAARMRHGGTGSTTSLFRMMCHDRNRSLFVQKWTDGTVPPHDPAALVSPAIVETVRAGRAAPRPLDLAALQSVAGQAAADLSVGMNRWMAEHAHFHALRTMLQEPAIRRRVVSQVSARAKRLRGR